MLLTSRSSSASPVRWSSRLERLASWLAVALGAIALAAVMACWAWRAWGPDGIHVPVWPPASPVAMLLATPLLGSTPAPAREADTVVLDGALRLLGVVADDNGDGYAVFRSASGVRVVRPGDTLGDGRSVLARIQPDAVVIREASGAERRIALRADITPDRSAGKTVAPSASSGAREGTRTAAATSAAQPSQACVPPGFKGNAVRLNAELLQGALMQPGVFTALLEVRDGGLVVRSDSGHAAMLGLQAADMLKSANGIALTHPEDIGGVILKPLAAGQSVLLKGLRGGQPQELLLLNVSRCPG